MDDGYSDDDAPDGGSQDESAQQPESAPVPVLIGPAEADHIVDEHGWEEGDALPSEAVLQDAVATVAGDAGQGSDSPAGGLLSLSMPSQEDQGPSSGDDRDTPSGGGEEVSGDDGRGDVEEGQRSDGAEEVGDAEDDEDGRSDAEDADGESDDGEGDGLNKVAAKQRGNRRSRYTTKNGVVISHDELGRMNQLDPLVERKVKEFNEKHGFESGDPEYLNSDRIKAIIQVESGGSPDWYLADPMQVNRKADWETSGKEKQAVGLKKGVSPGTDKGIEAGIEFLANKSYVSDGRGNKRFVSWDYATEKYGPNSRKKREEYLLAHPDMTPPKPYIDKVRDAEKQLHPSPFKNSGSGTDI